MTKKTTPSEGSQAILPTLSELRALFHQKHGQPDKVGWAPRRRYHFDYFLPADVYECQISKLVAPDYTWLDVGGGHTIFPENPSLSRELVARSKRVVAVDPSDNVHENGFVHEKVQCTLEDYRAESQFDLATMRMVVEHVDRPEAFVDALARVVKPGGRAVVLTVNRQSPIALVSRLIPHRFHHPIKRLFWGGEEKDTFPVCYLMNTREDLRRLFAGVGFQEESFVKLDDLSAFGQFRMLNYVEFIVWKVLRLVGASHPETCLMGVYVKGPTHRAEA